jgi:hypothetical protein
MISLFRPINRLSAALKFLDELTEALDTDGDGTAEQRPAFDYDYWLDSARYEDPQQPEEEETPFPLPKVR